MTDKTKSTFTWILLGFWAREVGGLVGLKLD